MKGVRGMSDSRLGDDARAEYPGVEALIRERDELREKLGDAVKVIAVAKDFRQMLKGTMSLLGPTGLRFTTALDETEKL